MVTGLVVGASGATLNGPVPSLAYVLDDEATVANAVSRALSECGLKGRAFLNASLFIVQTKLHSPALVIVDLALGETDAIEVMRQLDVLKYRGRVLLMSGNHAETLDAAEMIGRSHGLKMLPALQKPFRLADLRERLADDMYAGKAIDQAVLPQTHGQPDSSATLSLADALNNNWLELWYQPKLDLRSFAVCGAEALIRARHPEIGVVGPAGLLPAAGDPLYRPLTLFVLRQAVIDWKQFADCGANLKLSVNVPASVLSVPEFVNIWRRVLPADSRFPGLIIEVTEENLINNPEWTREVAVQLRLYKAEISVDDFGTGYSTLVRLGQLPFTEIKLDQSFVLGCAGDVWKRRLCQATIDLAHGMNAAVCAEGVECTDDLRTLIELGCDRAQGHLFARPMAVPKLVGLLATGASNHDGARA